MPSFSPSFDRFARLTARTFAIVLVFAAASAATGARAQDRDFTHFRVFLQDGSTLVSYGEFARVGDRVVFSVPIGPSSQAGPPPLRLVSIPSSSVDWPTTDRYRHSVHAAQYAATRGEAEFAALNSRVAFVLNEIGLTDDIDRRMALVRYARRLLNDWGRTSYGYRASEVAELSGFLDAIASEIQAAAGGGSVELALVANVGPPPTMPLLPAPTLKESVEQVLRAARLASDPLERITLLQAGLAVLDAGSPGWSESWVAAMRARAIVDLATETELERAYTTLRERVLAAADERMQAADVRGLEALVREVVSRDAELGRRRTNTVSALLTTLDRKLDAARRLRLARDKWSIEEAAYRTYHARVGDALDGWRRIEAALEDVRSLAGPRPGDIARVETRIGASRTTLAGVEPPEALRGVHAMLSSALQLAASACRLRRTAVTRGDMPTAWNASSAAAAAIMLVDRATGDLDRALKPPQLP